MPKKKKPTKKEERELKKALKKEKKGESIQTEYDGYMKELDAISLQLSSLGKSCALRLERNESMVQLYGKDCGGLNAVQIGELALGLQEPAILASMYYALEKKFSDIKRCLTDGKFKGKTGHQERLDSLSKSLETSSQTMQKLSESVLSVSTLKRRDAVRKLASEANALVETLAKGAAEQGALTSDMCQAVENALNTRDRLDSELKSLDVTIGMASNKDLIPDREQLGACRNQIEAALMELVQRHHQTMGSLADKQLTHNQPLIVGALFGNPFPAIDAVQASVHDTLALRSRAERLNALESTLTKNGLSVAHLAVESARWLNSLSFECVKLDRASKKLKEALQSESAHDHPVSFSGLVQGDTQPGNVPFSGPIRSEGVSLLKNG